MSDSFDALDDEIAEGARSPVSGVSSALAAGEALTSAEQKHVIFELPAYLIVQMSWFTAFGLQMVVFSLPPEECTRCVRSTFGRGSNGPCPFLPLSSSL